VDRLLKSKIITHLECRNVNISQLVDFQNTIHFYDSKLLKNLFNPNMNAKIEVAIKKQFILPYMDKKKLLKI
jgi:hypothetical protein